jgi:5-formyltetrahydrofolate cyclo-ligase
MDPQVAAFGRGKRAQLLAARQSMPSHRRKTVGDAITGQLDRLCARLNLAIVGLYWPINNEISLLPCGRALAQSRWVCACRWWSGHDHRWRALGSG